MFTENLDIFFDTDEHAETIVFGGYPIIAIDGGTTTEPSELDGVPVETRTITLKTSDVSVVFGQGVQVDGVKWIVNGISDDVGVSVVRLVRRVS